MTTARFAVALGAALAIAAPAAAQDFRPKEKGLLMLNARISGVLADAEEPILTGGGADSGLKAKVGDDVMPTLGLTYFLTDNLAIEAIAGTTQHEVKAVGPGTDVKVHETWVLPPVVTLQYRPTPNATISPYVGAGVSYMAFFSGKDKNGFEVDLDDGFGVALQAGADWNISGPWTLNLDAKKVWFDTDAKINGGALKSSVSLEPWVVSVGVGRKF